MEIRDDTIHDLADPKNVHLLLEETEEGPTIPNLSKVMVSNISDFHATFETICVCFVCIFFQKVFPNWRKMQTKKLCGVFFKDKEDVNRIMSIDINGKEAKRLSDSSAFNDLEARFICLIIGNILQSIHNPNILFQLTHSQHIIEYNHFTSFKN